VPGPEEEPEGPVQEPERAAELEPAQEPERVEAAESESGLAEESDPAQAVSASASGGVPVPASERESLESEPASVRVPAWAR
jgi:hypothetical protein